MLELHLQHSKRRWQPTAQLTVKSSNNYELWEHEQTQTHPKVVVSGSTLRLWFESVHVDTTHGVSLNRVSTSVESFLPLATWEFETWVWCKSSWSTLRSSCSLGIAARSKSALARWTFPNTIDSMNALPADKQYKAQDIASSCSYERIRCKSTKDKALLLHVHTNVLPTDTNIKTDDTAALHDSSWLLSKNSLAALKRCSYQSQNDL